jgi:hypothetical protein
MPHACGCFTETDLPREEFSMGSTEDMPAHPLLVERPEGGVQGAEGIAVGAGYREWEVAEDLLAAAFERDGALTETSSSVRATASPQRSPVSRQSSATRFHG